MLDELKVQSPAPAADAKDSDVKENGSNKSSPGLFLTNAVAKWNDEYPEPTLNNMSVSVTTGKLVAVIGPVGSGKVQFSANILISFTHKFISLDVSDPRIVERAAFKIGVVKNDRNRFVRRSRALALCWICQAEHPIRPALER